MKRFLLAIGLCLLLGGTRRARGMALEVAEPVSAEPLLEVPAVDATPDLWKDWSARTLDAAHEAAQAGDLPRLVALRAQTALARELHGTRSGRGIIVRVAERLRALQEDMVPRRVFLHEAQESSARHASEIWDSVRSDLERAPQAYDEERLAAVLAYAPVSHPALLSPLRLGLLQAGARAGLDSRVEANGTIQDRGTFRIPLAGEGDDRVFEFRFSQPSEAPGEIHVQLRVARRPPAPEPAPPERSRSLLDWLIHDLRRDDPGLPRNGFDFLAFLRERGVLSYQRWICREERQPHMLETYSFGGQGNAAVYQIEHPDGTTSVLKVHAESNRMMQEEHMRTWTVHHSFLLSEPDGTMRHLKYRNGAPSNNAALAEHRRETEGQ